MFSAIIKLQRDAFHSHLLECTVEIGFSSDLHYFRVIDYRGNVYLHSNSKASNLITKWRDVMDTLGYSKGVLPYDFITYLQMNHPCEYYSEDAHPYPRNFHLSC